MSSAALAMLHQPPDTTRARSTPSTRKAHRYYDAEPSGGWAPARQAPSPKSAERQAVAVRPPRRPYLAARPWSHRRPAAAR
ncbi:hypothetical protein [Nonomuraea dietziae]|uniref:hypothetical protein n=1 Tax=Nonomuraea dietziae TaxID=65515 RepID=UPI0031D72208